MQYNQLGNTGLMVSRLAVGAVTFTAGNRQLPTVNKTEKKEADAIVGKALDAGINFFDTADGYSGGESEELLGAALKGKRDHVVIGTKGGSRQGPHVIQGGLTRRHLMLAVENSLKRLRTDWIDVYVAHRDDPDTPLEETLTAFDDMVRSGKVRYIGFSNWPAWRAAAAIDFQRTNGLAQFCHGQMYYSLFGRDVENDTIPMMRHYGIGLTAWSPLAFGFLTGKYTRETMKNPDFRMSGANIFSFDLDQGFAIVERVRAIATRHNATVAQVALAWLLTNPTVSSVIFGVSKASQVDDNAGAAALTLTAEDLQELGAAMPPPTVYPNWFNAATADRVFNKALGR